jgi:hypothetical protein
MCCCVWVSNVMSHPKGSNSVGCMRTNSWRECMDMGQAVTGDRNITHDEEDRNLHP